MRIRSVEKKDWDEIWTMIKPVFRAGETYAFSPKISREEAFEVWVEGPKACFIALDERENILGTYYIKPNQPALGAHVCNCGYIVATRAQGQGIASQMCRHSQSEARALGFRAMQYNLVVATNEAAIRLWQKHGFEIVGTIPKAFKHSTRGFVDAHVMYKSLLG